jgi:SAM-dependent methyltransferase
LRHPLRKRQCRECGLGYRTSSEDLGKVYTEDYALYGNRPGADAFNQQRHPALAELITKAVEPLRPTRILEVGCGNGSTLSSVRTVWPEAETIGLEPSRAAVESARTAGHTVVQGMVAPSLPTELPGTFDLIYSIQVIEHTVDPVAFLQAQASRLAPGGVVVAVCPNGAIPHAEIIHPDHLFSFAPYHLATVAEKAHLTRRHGCEFTLDEAQEYNQIFVGEPRNGGTALRNHAMTTVPNDALVRLEQDRNAYLEKWSRLESYLSERVADAARLVCFGTGGWAANLAGYAPAIWDRVLACTVDGEPTARFFDKPVVAYRNLRDHTPDAVLVAVNPARQDVIFDRLRRDGFNAVRWNDLIDR